MKKLIYILSFCFALNSHAFTEVALTVDDLTRHGANAPNMSRLEIARTLLSALKKHNVPSVYGFINAEKVKFFPSDIKILQEWVEAGHPLGNHTWQHIDLNAVSLEEYFLDIEKNEPLLKDLSGLMDYMVFRYPYLHEGANYEKRNGVREYLQKQGYKIAQVTVDFGDYLWNAPYARCVTKNNSAAIEWLVKSYVKAAVERLNIAIKLSERIFGRNIKHILLTHVGGLNAVALEKLIEAYQAHGVKFIDLHTAMADEAYTINPNQLTTGGANFLDQMARANHVFYPYVPPLPKKELESICR